MGLHSVFFQQAHYPIWICFFLHFILQMIYNTLESVPAVIHGEDVGGRPQTSSKCLLFLSPSFVNLNSDIKGLLHDTCQLTHHWGITLLWHDHPPPPPQQCIAPSHWCIQRHPPPPVCYLHQYISNLHTLSHILQVTIHSNSRSNNIPYGVKVWWPLYPTNLSNFPVFMFHLDVNVCQGWQPLKFVQ